MIQEPIHVVAARSAWISLSATLLAGLWSVPLAILMARKPRAGSGVAAAVLESLVGIPTVLVGLAVYLLISRRGPLGFLGLLYTPWAIVLGESLLVTPLIVATAYRGLSSWLPRAWETVESLGGGGLRGMFFLARESLESVAASLTMGFSRAVGELGVALIVGGNIAGRTRTLSASIALATSMGMYGYAIKLGTVLLLLSLGVSLAGRLALAWLDRW